MIKDPRAVEPLIAVLRNALREILRKVIRAGTSLIVATHHLPDIVPEVERVVCLKDGRIVSDGPKASALTPESLSRLFETPVEVTQRDGYDHAW